MAFAQVTQTAIIKWVPLTQPAMPIDGVVLKIEFCNLSREKVCQQ